MSVLYKYTTKSKIRSIHMYLECLLKIRQAQHWLGGDRGLQGFKCSPVVIRLCPSLVLFQQISQRTSDARITLNEPTVVVCHAKEGSKLQNKRRSRPLKNRLDFDGLHEDLALKNLEAQKEHIHTIENTLFLLDIKPVLP